MNKGCLFIKLRTYTHTNTHIYIHECHIINKRNFYQIHINIDIYKHTHGELSEQGEFFRVHIYIYIYIYISVIQWIRGIFLSNFMCTHTHTHAHKHTHIYIHECYLINKGNFYETSYIYIWQSYRETTIWQSLVVSGDSAGVLWASGNDALAPKPCLNPESSSDEGFVRSNAVV